MNICEEQIIVNMACVDEASVESALEKRIVCGGSYLCGQSASRCV